MSCDLDCYLDELDVQRPRHALEVLIYLLDTRYILDTYYLNLPRSCISYMIPASLKWTCACVHNNNSGL